MALSFDRPVDLKTEDSPELPPTLSIVPPAPDAQDLMIELSEMAQRAGSQAVQLLHEFDYGRDLIESHRRAKVHADEIHRAAAGLMELAEALAKALRAAGHLSTPWAD